MPLYGIDGSNHNGPPTSYRNQSWYKDAEFTIWQAINPPRPYAGWDVGGYTAEQLRAAKEDGKKVGVYIWLWNSFSSSAATKADIASRLALIPDDVPLDMRLWLDMEDTTQDHGPARQQDVLDALEVMDQWAGDHSGWVRTGLNGEGRRPLYLPGIYSGDWYLRGYMDAWFPPDRVYWQANYSLSANGAEQALLPARPLIQYTSTPVDMDVMLESEIVVPEGPPVTDEERKQMQDKIDGLVNALGYIDGDVLKPLRALRTKSVKAAVAEIDRVVKQFVG